MKYRRIRCKAKLIFLSDRPRASGREGDREELSARACLSSIGRSSVGSESNEGGTTSRTHS
ncbi:MULTISPECIES: hypothetical protein, partial [unclassified Paenibacillus]|uniref:hypothetical protein n=1 Tax=unclassified Paenibacillus TaxID=185978 RepID=UPI001C92C536